MIVGRIKPRLRKHIATIYAITFLLPFLYLDFLELNYSHKIKRWQQLARRNLERSLSLTKDRTISAVNNQISTVPIRQISHPSKLTENYNNILQKIKMRSSFVHEKFLLSKSLKVFFQKYPTSLNSRFFTDN